MASLKGHLLVASPHLADPNFARAVVLLIHHSEEGTFGVVLNRPGESTIKELWSDLGEAPCETDQHIHLGGPVSGPLMAIHTTESLSELEIVPGLYFAAQRGNIEKLLRQGSEAFRLFVGHSGWGSGQLEGELEEGSWLTAPATIDYVFADETELWKRVAQDIGKGMLSSMLKIRDIPNDPTVN
jgi:putative transcriptional regulator